MIVVTLYLLLFVRGLAWQWRGILSATRTAAPPIPAAAPRVPAQQAPLPAPGAPGAPGQANAAPPVAQPNAAPAGARVALPPTDEPAPRNATDRNGVYYDERGVAITGIDADPNGVYNVPPGRQLRIGGPSGQLFDVGPGGKLTPATRIRD